MTEGDAHSLLMPDRMQLLIVTSISCVLQPAPHDPGIFNTCPDAYRYLGVLDAACFTTNTDAAHE